MRNSNSTALALGGCGEHAASRQTHLRCSLLPMILLGPKLSHSSALQGCQPLANLPARHEALDLAHSNHTTRAHRVGEPRIESALRFTGLWGAWPLRS